jgi:hypothetical protein
MAILKDVPGIEVAMQIDGKDVTEYDPDENEEHCLATDTKCPTVTKYIECSDDAEFAIRMTISTDYQWGYKDHSLSLRPRLDGHELAGKLFEQSRCAGNAGQLIIADTKAFCPQTQRWNRYKLKFSAISTSMATLRYLSDGKTY